MSRGFIRLYVGPMFSGKTSSMCNDIERYSLASQLCIIVKYSNDTRYDSRAKKGGMMTHSGNEHHRVPIVHASRLADVFDEISEYDKVGIDELQFYPDGPEIIQKLANMGKGVICSALDTNYLAKPFLRMPECEAVAEEIFKLKAVCMRCNMDASFTMRLTSGGDEIEIGGSDKYISVCRKCMWAERN